MRRVSGGGSADEAHLRLRAQLMEAVRDVIQHRGLRQREAAVLFEVAQPRVSDLVRGKLTLFSIDTLVSMLAAAGVVVELELRAPDDAGRPRQPRTAGRSADHASADRAVPLSRAARQRNTR